MSRPDLDALLNALLPFAKQMTQKQGSFIPFAASMTAEGDISLIMGDIAQEGSEAQEVIDLLTIGLREKAEATKIKASGICLDTKVIPPGQNEKTDAILARLEHQDGEAIDVYLPYRGGFLGKVSFSDIFAAAGTRQVFSVAG